LVNTESNQSPSSQKTEQLFSSAHLKDGLGQRAARGGVIAVVGQLAKLVLQVLGSAAMARLLMPKDFGIVAMGLTVTSLAGMFADLGLSTATVQSREINQDTVSALFYANIGIGIVVMLLAMSVAPVAAIFFNDWRVLPVVMAMALSIPIMACAMQHRALMQRGMRWLTIQWTEITALFVATGTGVLLAWVTSSYWALVVQSLTSAFTILVLSWIVCPWRPGRVRRWDGARSSLRFGIHLTIYNVLDYFLRSDNILIGWRWGPIELGYYSRAYNLLLLPLSVINGPIASAVIPALSRLQDDSSRWRKSFLDALSIASLLSSGAAAVLTATAAPLVIVLYGPAWSESADIFSFLAISIFALSMTTGMMWVNVSLGRTRRMLMWNLIRSPLAVMSFVIGLPYGAKGVAIAFTAMACVTAIPGIAFQVNRTPVTWLDVLRITGPATLTGIFAASTALILTAIDPPSNPLSVLVMRTLTAGSVHCVVSLSLLFLDPAFVGARRQLLWLTRKAANGLV
jgi:PST family polysaccharide transporter